MKFYGRSLELWSYLNYVLNSIFYLLRSFREKSILLDIFFFKIGLYFFCFFFCDKAMLLVFL